MKPLRFLTALFGLIVALNVTGCSSGPKASMSRIDANREEYESWPIEVQEAVLAGRVEKGMTPKQVEVSIGKPKGVDVKSTRKGSQEIWTYKGGSGGLKGSQISIGTYGAGISSAPLGTYDEEYQVVFEDGVVVSSSVPETGS